MRDIDNKLPSPLAPLPQVGEGKCFAPFSQSVIYRGEGEKKKLPSPRALFIGERVKRKSSLLPERFWRMGEGLGMRV